MTERVIARPATSFLLMFIAALGFLLLLDGPARAHHRSDHGNGKDSVATGSTDAGTDGSGATGTTTDTTATEVTETTTVSSASAEKFSKSPAASTSAGTTTSTASAGGSGGGSTKAFEPDPVQTPTPPATTGPRTCPAYDDGNAGPYDHTNCNTTQGLHGNGGNGKCAGCTGQADDKWPGGQNVGDHNNGYECDHNGGVGKGNPAHSRCASPPSPCVDNPNTPHNECAPPPPCVDNPNTPHNECAPPPVCVDNPNTPRNECGPNPPGPCVDNPNTPMVNECKPKPPKDEVEGKIIGNIPDIPQGRRITTQGALPVTGATLNHYLWLALLLMGAGSLLLWRVGRRSNV